jgi:hypothetical protein
VANAKLSDTPNFLALIAKLTGQPGLLLAAWPDLIRTILRRENEAHQINVARQLGART